MYQVSWSSIRQFKDVLGSVYRFVPEGMFLIREFMLRHFVIVLILWLYHKTPYLQSWSYTLWKKTIISFKIKCFKCRRWCTRKKKVALSDALINQDQWFLILITIVYKSIFFMFRLHMRTVYQFLFYFILMYRETSRSFCLRWLSRHIRSKAAVKEKGKQNTTLLRVI